MHEQHETCTVTGCERKHKARGYCASHYARHFRGVETAVTLRSRDTNPPAKCTEPGCTNQTDSKGLCKMHYARLLRHGHTRYRDRKRAPKPCSVDGCDQHTYAKGLCHVHYSRVRLRKLKYGVTAEQLSALRKEQDGLCAICHRPPSAVNGLSGKAVDLHLDHNHDTKQVRGLLCAQCNRAIGLLGENAETLRSAIAYLEKYSMPAT